MWAKNVEKKLMIKFKYVFWIKYPWWTSKSKVTPLCFKFQSWCLKPRLIYAILLFSWPNSCLITRNTKLELSFETKDFLTSNTSTQSERDLRAPDPGLVVSRGARRRSQSGLWGEKCGRVWPSPSSRPLEPLHTPEFLLFQTFGSKNWLGTLY